MASLDIKSLQTNKNKYKQILNFTLNTLCEIIKYKLPLVTQAIIKMYQLIATQCFLSFHKIFYNKMVYR